MSKLTNLDNPIGLLEFEPFAGDILVTLTGRQTTPYPALSTKSPADITKSRRAYQAWLLTNTVEEARAKGDSFNLRMFENDLEQIERKKGFLPPASVEIAELYLFESQPRLYKSVLNSLDEVKAKVESKSASASLQDDLFGNPEVAFDPDSLLPIVSDSWDRLRKQDVMRLIGAGVDHGVAAIDSLVNRILGVRPDLRNEVSSCLVELTEDNADIELGKVAEALLTISNPEDKSIDEDIKLLEELGEAGLIEQKKFGSVDRLRRLGLILDDKAKDKKLVERVMDEIQSRDQEGSAHWNYLNEIKSRKFQLDVAKQDYLTINQFIANIEVGEVDTVRVSKYQDELVKYRELAGAVKAGRIHWKTITGAGGSLTLANNIINSKVEVLEKIIAICPLFDPQIAEAYMTYLAKTVNSAFDIIASDQQVENESNDEANEDDPVEYEDDLDNARIVAPIVENKRVEYSRQFTMHARMIFAFVRRNSKIPDSMLDRVYGDNDLDEAERKLLLDYAEGVTTSIIGWEPPPIFVDLNNRDLSFGDVVLDLGKKQFFKMDGSVKKESDARYVSFAKLNEVKYWNEEIGFTLDDAIAISNLANEYADNLQHTQTAPFHLNSAYGIHFKYIAHLEFAADGDNNVLIDLIRKRSGIEIGSGTKAILAGLLKYCDIDPDVFHIEKLKSTMDRQEKRIIEKFSNGQEVAATYKQRILDGYNEIKDEKGTDKYLINPKIDQGFNLSERGIKYAEIAPFLKAVIAWDKAQREFDLKHISTSQLYDELMHNGAYTAQAERLDTVEADSLSQSNDLPELYLVLEGQDWVTDLSEVAKADPKTQKLIYKSLTDANNHATALRVRALYLSASDQILHELKQLEKNVNKAKSMTPRLQVQERILSSMLDRLEYSDDLFAERVLLNTTSNGHNWISEETSIKETHDHIRLGVFKNQNGHYQAVATQRFNHAVTEPYFLKRFAVQALINGYSDFLNRAYEAEHGINPTNPVIKTLQKTILALGHHEYAAHISNQQILGDAVLIKVYNEESNNEYFSIISPDESKAIHLTEDESVKAKAIWQKISEFQRPADSCRAVVSYCNGIQQYAIVKGMEISSLNEKANTGMQFS